MGTFTADVVVARQLVAWFSSRSRAHGHQLSTDQSPDGVSATQLTRAVRVVSERGHCKDAI